MKKSNINTGRLYCIKNLLAEDELIMMISIRPDFYNEYRYEYNCLKIDFQKKRMLPSLYMDTGFNYMIENRKISYI